MNIVVAMLPEVYDGFWKKCPIESREYAILRNGLVVPQREDNGRSRLVEIACDITEARILREVALAVCPDAVPPIEDALAVLKPLPGSVSD